MVTVSALFDDLPVTLNSDEFESYTGTSLEIELKTEKQKDIVNFLDRAHESLYYKLIYKVGGKSLKDRIINNNFDALKKPLKMCLIAQINYMIESGGDYGTLDGSNINADGSLNLTDNKTIDKKIIAPKVYSILESARPNLILGMQL